MRSPSRRIDGGFTLIEVLVALGIAGGSLLLLLSSNNSSLRKSVAAREDLRVVRLADSKFEECLLGVEKAVSGEIENLPGWRWEVFRTPSHVGELRKLKQIEFVLRRPDGTKALEWRGFREEE